MKKAVCKTGKKMGETKAEKLQLVFKSIKNSLSSTFVPSLYVGFPTANKRINKIRQKANDAAQHTFPSEIKVEQQRMCLVYLGTCLVYLGTSLPRNIALLSAPYTQKLHVKSVV